MISSGQSVRVLMFFYSNLCVKSREVEGNWWAGPHNSYYINHKTKTCMMSLCFSLEHYKTFNTNIFVILNCDWDNFQSLKSSTESIQRVLHDDHYISIYRNTYLRAIPFSKVHWGRGPELFWGVPATTIQFCLPPYRRILNSILHLETPCATPSSHILIYLIPPIPALRITFRSPPG